MGSLCALTAIVNDREKNEIRDECQKWIREIQQMQRSLGDREDKLEITPPLLSCLECFKEKHKQVSRTYEDRYDSIKSGLICAAGECETRYLTIKQNLFMP